MMGREHVPNDTIESSSAKESLMRYSTDHKQATRHRILQAAGRRFKQEGIDGACAATVMSDAGMTNGAFCAHFASKEDLVARRHRVASSPDKRRGGSNRRAHALRIDARHAATRQSAHRPRPVRPSPHPQRRDGHEAAERPGMTPLQTARPAGTHAQRATRRPTSPAQAGLGRRPLHRVMAVLTVESHMATRRPSRELPRGRVAR